MQKNFFTLIIVLLLLITIGVTSYVRESSSGLPKILPMPYTQRTVIFFIPIKSKK